MNIDVKDSTQPESDVNNGSLTIQLRFVEHTNINIKMECEIMVDTTIYSWICDKKDHLTLLSKIGDSTPDCPVCYLTMEVHDLEMNVESVGKVIELGQEILSRGKRPFYWYNVTQTVVFHTNGRIDIENHEDSEP